MELCLFNDRALSSEEVAKIEETVDTTAVFYGLNVKMEDQCIADTYAYMLSFTSATGTGQEIELEDMIDCLKEIRNELRKALKDWNDWYICFEIG